LRSSPITTFTSKFTGKTFVLNGTLLIDDFADTFASYRKNRKPGFNLNLNIYFIKELKE